MNWQLFIPLAIVAAGFLFQKFFIKTKTKQNGNSATTPTTESA